MGRVAPLLQGKRHNDGVIQDEFAGKSSASSYNLRKIIIFFAAAFISACSTQPLIPFTTDTAPLIMVPVTQAGVVDKRGRFREIYCKVLESRGETLPDYRPCSDALTQVGIEPPGTGKTVELGPSRRRLIVAIVPGLGADCVADWIDSKGTVAEHIRQFDFDLTFIDVDSLSSIAHNALQIRDAILDMHMHDAEKRLVLVGYSKGIADILEAIVSYPEIRKNIAAVVSVAGAVGGTPLANNASKALLSIFTSWPGAQCTIGDGGAIESLRTETRKKWLADHDLPRDIAYYSLATYPQPDRISAVLKPTYNKLSKVDARNDGQVIFYDQLIPGGVLVAYINADHWAAATPISRTHTFLKNNFVDHNDYPREALMEAILRFIEEDLSLHEK
jgi:hypothetical protein